MGARLLVGTRSLHSIRQLPNSRIKMGFDVLSPILYTYNKDADGKINDVQSMTLLGSAHPDHIFKKNVPGMWFTCQTDEIMGKLFDEYEKEPYPSDAELD